MSILLDAVTRAKNQEQDACIDPVLTPRAQYDNFSGNSQRNLIILFGVFILILLSIIVWLGQGYLVGNFSQVSEPKLAPTLQQEPKEKPTISPQHISLENKQSVRLAGKVALPLATDRPRAERYFYNNPKPQVSEYVEPASISTSRLAGEPIILGANANQKGQDMLAALKFEVNQAASEVGLETDSATPKNYQDENNLVAVFEAALKAVEVKNSLAAPMTAFELDPIPATKPDSLPKYGQLPAGLQLQVPEFNITAHVYSTNPNNRWLNVDGAELQEGDSIGGKLEIIEIRPRDVVLSIQGTEFKVPAI
ncbi:MAG: general secretion pathway protein GspB [Shewanella sp.]